MKILAYFIAEQFHYLGTKLPGVMVDIVMNEPLSLAKAKKYGIQALKLPLDKYINWRAGGKHLQMNQVSCFPLFFNTRLLNYDINFVIFVNFRFYRSC